MTSESFTQLTNRRLCMNNIGRRQQFTLQSGLSFLSQLNLSHERDRTLQSRIPIIENIFKHCYNRLLMYPTSELTFVVNNHGSTSPGNVGSGCGATNYIAPQELSFEKSNFGSAICSNQFVFSHPAPVAAFPLENQNKAQNIANSSLRVYRKLI